MSKLSIAVLLLASSISSSVEGARSFALSTGSPDGRMAMLARPEGGTIETEPADDFILSTGVILHHASFTGLMASGQSLDDINHVIVKIYRVFPLDSTSPPSGNVPTRTNSPSDVAFESRDSVLGELTFNAFVESASFSASNSVVNGIHKIPNQTTQGEGPVLGEEVTVNVTFNPVLALPAGHYYVVPEVGLAAGNFLWLSVARPLFTGDLQMWIRNANLVPDWLRVGTDIVGGSTPPTFNGSFSLIGILPPNDFNADGMADLFWRNTSTGSDAMWLMSGAAVMLSASMPDVADPNFKVVGIGDFQGDGKADILWRNSVSGANVLWFIDGGSVAASALLPTVDPSWIVAGVGDFQGDGFADILWRNTATGDNAVWLMNGPAVVVSAPLPMVADPSFHVAGVGDFQGDGKDDILWRNSATGANVVWLMNGINVAVSALLPTVGDPNWIVAGLGDFQGDGKADILWRNTSTGDNAMWLINGISVAVAASLPSVPDTNWKIVRVADFQGDGKADILWRNNITGANAQWLMDGSSVAVSSALPTVPDTNWTIAGPP